MTSGAGGRERTVLDRSSATFAGFGGGLVIAGGLAAAVNSAAPFAHGSWLAAYLVLVGGVSQVVLGLGHRALLVREPPWQATRAQLLLWNAGSVAVPAGVLSDAASLVTLGSAALLAALACFAAGVRGVPLRAPVVGYHVLIVALAASVIVGSALADAAPGGWF
jgi:hypothetical protein